MHRALLVCEVLDPIFRYLQTSGCSQSVRSLAALARTCRAFNDLALNVLWANLDDLTPLIRCLPGDAWLCQRHSAIEVYGITRPLTTTEWDILRQYTRRIRKLSGVKGIFSHLSPTTTRVLCYPPTPDPLFPNLRQVRWNDHSTLPCILHFVGHQTTYFNLEVAVLDWSVEEWSIISSLATRCPNMTHFSLPSCIPSVHLDDVIVSGVLCNWPNLETVACPFINKNALVHLASLPKLQSLAFRLRATALPESEPLDHAFRSLRVLSLTSASLVDVTNLMSRFSVSLEKLHVTVNHSVPRDVLSSYLTALKETCQHDRLYRMCLEVETSQSASVPAATLVDFSPLICFVNLTTIRINTHCPIELSGKSLLHLTSAWPKLEVLSLNNETGWRTSSGVTPECLAVLVRKCELLRELYIVLDTTDFTKIPVERPGGGFDSPMEYFGILDSVIEQECVTPLAAFLSDLFPTLHSLDIWMPCHVREAKYEERWFTVQKQVFSPRLCT